MLGRGRWAPSARLELKLEDWGKYAVDVVSLGESGSIMERNPGTLILPIATLHLLMHSLLYIPLQNPRPCGLIIVAHFQDMRRVNVIIGSAAHHTVTLDVELENRYLC